MVAFYVVVDADVLYKSKEFELPPVLSDEDIITFVQGVMFEDSWCPGTEHAIYVDSDGTGYAPIYNDEFPFEDYPCQYLRDMVPTS